MAEGALSLFCGAGCVAVAHGATLAEGGSRPEKEKQHECRQTELFKTTMNDVLGRVVTIRRTERDPSNGSGAHRHPGSHTFGYVLEGAYEVKIDDGPLQKLGPGDTFYEPPGALHAVSRNASTTQPVKYLVISISDPTKPQTVTE